MDNLNDNGALALIMAIFGYQWKVENPDGSIDYRYTVNQDGTVTRNK